MVVYSQSLQILFELMLKLYLKVYLKDTPVSGYTVHSTGLGLMSLTSVVILSRKIILARHTSSGNAKFESEQPALNRGGWTDTLCRSGWMDALSRVGRIDALSRGG